jgi:hypothetical protein
MDTDAPSSHVKVHWQLTEDQIEKIVGFDNSNVTRLCRMLYNDCKKVHQYVLQEKDSLEILFGPFSKRAENLFRLSLLRDHTTIDGLEPIYRFDFILTRQGLRLLEITPVPAPMVFMSPLKWKSYGEQIWPFKHIVILVISDSFSRETTKSGLRNYVQNKSANYLKQMVSPQVKVHVLHYDDIDEIALLSFQPSQRVGFYFWCESKFFEERIDVLTTWNELIYTRKWFQVTDFSRFLIIGNKAFHVESLLKKSNAHTLLKLCPYTEIFSNINTSVMKEKDNWVLKKKLSCEGADVFCGKYLEEEYWEQVLSECLKASDTTGYVLQRYEEPEPHCIEDTTFFIEARAFFHPLVPEADTLWYFIPAQGKNKKANLSVNPNIRLARINKSHQTIREE